MTADILAFPLRAKTHCHELHAPDGRSWCASSYFKPQDLAKLESGRDYTPDDLVQLYRLPKFKDTGKPGLHVKPGEELPKTVRYVVYPIATWGEQ